MLGLSALYHRVTWTPATRLWMRRADHVGIFLLIAGTYTPVGLIALHGAWRVTILAVVWGGAGCATLMKLCWVHAPKWLAALVIAAAPASRALPAAAFVVSATVMLGTSALYHRVTWSPARRLWMRRADHAAIF